MNLAWNLIDALATHFFKRGQNIYTGGQPIDTAGGNLNLGAGNLVTNGLVDGVDVSALSASHNSLGSSYTAHIANPNAHHAQQHALDGSDHTGTLSWAKVSKVGSSLTDLATRAHSSLTGIGPNDHHAQQHVLATAVGLGADHAVSGLTAGHVLRATGATAAAFGALLDGDIPSSIARDSEVTAAISAHAGEADPHAQYHNDTRGDARYYKQTQFSSSTGASSAPLKTSAAGLLEIKGIALGKVAAADQVVAAGDIKTDGRLQAAEGIVSGSTSQNPIAGRILLAQSSTPSTPPSGFGVIWVNTSGQLNFKNDSGASVNLGP